MMSNLEKKNKKMQFKLMIVEKKFSKQFKYSANTISKYKVKIGPRTFVTLSEIFRKVKKLANDGEIKRIHAAIPLNKNAFPSKYNDYLQEILFHHMHHPVHIQYKINLQKENCITTKMAIESSNPGFYSYEIPKSGKFLREFAIKQDLKSDDSRLLTNLNKEFFFPDNGHRLSLDNLPCHDVEELERYPCLLPIVCLQHTPKNMSFPDNVKVPLIHHMEKITNPSSVGEKIEHTKQILNLLTQFARVPNNSYKAETRYFIGEIAKVENELNLLNDSLLEVGLTPSQKLYIEASNNYHDIQ